MLEWKSFSVRQLKPKGWLKRQLEIQAEGLSGHLDEVWPDIADSGWIGGKAEAWERMPYWLDGFIPMAYLLERDDLISKANRYIDIIISNQQPDGWICPCKKKDIPSYDSWAIQLFSKVLVVYYKCSADERIPDVLYRMMKNYYDLLSSGKIKLFGWGEYRWFETFVALNFLHERYQEPWIQELAHILRDQGVDFQKNVDQWKTPFFKGGMAKHIVGITLMLKYEALTHELLGEEYTDRASYFVEMLSQYNGTAVASFTGDEYLSGLSAIQGTELCAIVEQMYSYEQLFMHTGDHKWLEWLEILCFNALPATISDDMWAHQYDQQVNQIACMRFPGKPIYATNGPEAGLFGLEPGYGCCTANFSQGWPKFALSAFMHRDNTVLNAIPVPSSLSTECCDILLETNYPFEHTFTYTVKAKQDFSFLIRIPSFAKNICVDAVAVDVGKYLSFGFLSGQERKIMVSYQADIELLLRPHNLRTVKCGSLVFSLPIAYEKIMYEYTKWGVERKFPYCDYEYAGKSDWNYGYSDVSFHWKFHGISDVPFSSEHPPVTVCAKMQKIPWGLEDRYEYVCAKTPKCTVPYGPQEIKELYPYGCAKLRMTEMPMV